MLTKTTKATEPMQRLNEYEGSLQAQARRMMMETMKAAAVPRKPRMNAIVPRILAPFRSPLSQALSERAAKARARNPKGQLQVPRRVKMAIGKCDGGFSPRKFGGCTEFMVVGRSPW